MKKSCKRVVASMLLACIAVSFAISTPVAAAGGINIAINNTALHIPAEFGAPFYDSNSRLQIPLRYIIESCGYEVDWSAASKAATISTSKGDVVVTLNSDKLATPNGTVQMDTSATIKDDRTYIPLRYVLEALNFKVKWSRDNAGDNVSINGVIGETSLRKPMNGKQIAASCAPSVFYIEVFESREDYIQSSDYKMGSGSGFFIDPSGIAVTNYHVIFGSYGANIHMSDGSKYPIQSVISYDSDRDIAIVKVSDVAADGSRIAFPFLRMGNPANISNGENIFALGSPLGLSESISDGIISNKSRLLQDEKFPCIQISAPISHGSSGGALVNEYGEVIGVTSASLIDGQNLNLAVPLDYVLATDLSQQGVAYHTVYETEFRKYIRASRAMLAEKIVYEDIEITSDGYAQYIGNGQTLVGSFDSADEMDFYTFYTPVTISLALVAGGMRLDSESYENGNSTLDTFYLTLDKIPGETFLEATPETEIDGSPIQYLPPTFLKPGRYYICAMHTLEDNTAWHDRDYFIFVRILAE